jgi:diguanylate cyclase (GGDEF)-like protein
MGILDSGWLSLDVTSALLLLFVVFSSLQFSSRRQVANRVLRISAYISLGMVVCDLFSSSSFKDPGLIICSKIGSYLYFFLTDLLLVSWYLYSDWNIFETSEKKELGWLIASICISAVDFICSNVSLFNGMYWSYDSNGVYVRGNLFIIHVILLILSVLQIEAFIIHHRRLVDRRYLTALIFFPLMPIIGLGAQSLFFLPYGFVGISIGFLTVLTNIQGRSLDFDYLTGAYNRRKLDNLIQDKIIASDEKKTFSAILIDLNHFKSINDRFGHIVGDQALCDAVSIMNRCISKHEIIARYGGDEFCIISSKQSEEEISALKASINKEIAKFNSLNNHQYTLGFAMGSAVYDYSSKMNVQDFESFIDSRMYQNKEECHRQEGIKSN